MNQDSAKNTGLRGVKIADSKISLVDGEQGKLVYRGYIIQDLAKHATFEEVIYLLLMGGLPNKSQLDELNRELKASRVLPPPVLAQMLHRPRSATPMDVMQGVVTSLADFDPDSGSTDRKDVYRSCLRLISQFALAAAAWQRIQKGESPVEVDPDQSHAAAFLQGLWGRKASAAEARLMDLLLVLHAEHSLNASTFAVREVASTQAHLYASVSAGVGALSGALHGGANANVMRMLLEISQTGSVTEWVAKRLESGQRIMGLGHAVYKTEDPRAGILRQVAKEVLAGREEEKWFKLGLEVEKIGRGALREKKNMDLYPNVDFYSSPVLYGLGFSIDMFPVFFAVSRVSGWCAHYLEERFADAQPKPALYRPDAEYVGRYCGEEGCSWSPLEERVEGCPIGPDFKGCDS